MSGFTGSARSTDQVPHGKRKNLFFWNIYLTCNICADYRLKRGLHYSCHKIDILPIMTMRMIARELWTLNVENHTQDGFFVQIKPRGFSLPRHLPTSTSGFPHFCKALKGLISSIVDKYKDIIISHIMRDNYDGFLSWKRIPWSSIVQDFIWGEYKNMNIESNGCLTYICRL